MKSLLFLLFLLITCVILQFGNIQTTNAQDVQKRIILGKTLLPAKFPHLNSLKEHYLVGSGMICAFGSGNGQLKYIAGPTYTSPNFIHNERITIIIDGVEHELEFEMFRASETGSFYGNTQVGDMKILLLDYAVPGLSIFSRLVRVSNSSSNTKHTVQLKSYLTPQLYPGSKDTTLNNSEGSSSAVLLKMDTTQSCMMGNNSTWVKNWDDRFLLSTWTKTQSKVHKDKNVYQILSGTKKIKGNKSETFNLIHYVYFKNDEENKISLDDLIARNGELDAEKAIVHWQQWFRNVPPAYSLANIKDTKARNIVEGGLYIIKTNQTVDGGMVANQTWYNLSWTRDAYCGLRGLLATGHFDELKQFLFFMNNVYKAFKFIPNAVSTGSNAYALYNGNAENNPNRHVGQYSPCPEANTAPETPALLVLVARDYFKATNDIKTLLEVNESLQYSMDIQLKHAIANNYKLEFSGDETELCGAVNTSFAGFDRDLSKFWSMTSMALFSASLDFYMDYLTLKKQSINSYYNSFNNTTCDLKIVSQKLNDAFENDFWRTDLPDNRGGVYDWCRIKMDNSFPNGRITNFSLFPVYYKMKPNIHGRFETNVKTIGSYFKESENILPLVPIVGDDRYLGHNLGYLLWSLIQVNDPQKTKIYNALVDGKLAQCWGSFNEAYNTDGTPNNNNLRTFETGVNIDALAKYWKLGE